MNTLIVSFHIKISPEGWNEHLYILHPFSVSSMPDTKSEIRINDTIYSQQIKQRDYILTEYPVKAYHSFLNANTRETSKSVNRE